MTVVRPDWLNHHHNSHAIAESISPGDRINVYDFDETLSTQFLFGWASFEYNLVSNSRPLEEFERQKLTELLDANLVEDNLIQAAEKIRRKNQKELDEGKADSKADIESAQLTVNSMEALLADPIEAVKDMRQRLQEILQDPATTPQRMETVLFRDVCEAGYLPFEVFFNVFKPALFEKKLTAEMAELLSENTGASLEEGHPFGDDILYCLGRRVANDMFPKARNSGESISDEPMLLLSKFYVDSLLWILDQTQDIRASKTLSLRDALIESIHSEDKDQKRKKLRKKPTEQLIGKAKELGIDIEALIEQVNMAEAVPLITQTPTRTIIATASPGHFIQGLMDGLYMHIGETFTLNKAMLRPEKQWPEPILNPALLAVAGTGYAYDEHHIAEQGPRDLYGDKKNRFIHYLVEECGARLYHGAGDSWKDEHDSDYAIIELSEMATPLESGKYYAKTGKETPWVELLKQSVKDVQKQLERLAA